MPVAPESLFETYEGHTLEARRSRAFNGGYRELFIDGELLCKLHSSQSRLFTSGKEAFRRGRQLIDRRLGRPVPSRMAIETPNVIHASANFITYANGAAPLLSPKGSGVREVTRAATGVFRVFLVNPLPAWNDGSGLDAPACHVIVTVGGAWKSIAAQLSADGTYVQVTTRQNTDGANTDFNEVIPVTVLLYPTQS